MKTRISTTIEAGDLVHHHGRLWMAVKYVKTRPCYSQCAMYVDGACRGYCYRWANGDDFVFHLAGLSVQDATEIVETPDLIGEFLREGDGTSQQKAHRRYYESLKAKREADKQLNDAKKKTKERGQGSVVRVGNRYRADFYMDGNRYWYASPHLAEVEAWLDEMNAKKQALKELERMKKK